MDIHKIKNMKNVEEQNKVNFDKKYEFFYDKEKFIFCYYYENDYINKTFWKKGLIYEIDLLKKLQDLNLKGTYVDAGAHFGNHTIYFSKFCMCNKIISIEGHPLNYLYLSKNIELNNCKNTISYNRVISNIDNKLCRMNTYIKNTGFSGVVDENSTKFLSPTNLENTSITLDTLLKDEVDISLIKFDIELHEYKGLLGCEKIIQKFKPVIVIENHKNNKDYQNILNFLKKHNYSTDGFSYAQNTLIYI
tara:strand:- start:1005 stop:1748 length:744 start_codon:yes stop_codon:yes gene_type:complete